MELTKEEKAFAVQATAMHGDLIAALADVFAMMDEGYLVRDTSEDGRPDWAQRQFPYVQRLSKARETLEKALEYARSVANASR